MNCRLLHIATFVATGFITSTAQTLPSPAPENPVESVEQTDKAPATGLELTFATEANYGHRHGQEHPAVLDFPHITLDATWTIGRGWSVVAEGEYECFYQDGTYKGHFSDDFAMNKLFVRKQWSGSLATKVGVVEVPVGVTNSGGAALTIYDPLSEASLLPMTWHEAGGTMMASAGKFDFQLSALRYGAAARTDLHLLSNSHIGLAAFWGNSRHGSVHQYAPDFYGTRSVFTAGIDFDIEERGWIIDGSALYVSHQSAHSVGVEVGRDLFATSEHACGLSLIPFVRYDGVFHTGAAPLNQYTAGFNLGYGHLILKSEHYWRLAGGNHSAHGFDVSLGYEITF